MVENLIEIINIDQLEILGIEREAIYYTVFFFVTLLLSLFIFILIHLLFKYRFLFVLYYLIICACLFILHGLLPFDAVKRLSIIFVFHLIALYGYCNSLYLLICYFISDKIRMAK